MTTRGGGGMTIQTRMRNMTLDWGVIMYTLIRAGVYPQLGGEIRSPPLLFTQSPFITDLIYTLSSLTGRDALSQNP